MKPMSSVPENFWKVQHWRRGELLWECNRPNLVTTAGKNLYLDSTLKTGVTAPAWYIGLVDNAGFSGYAAGDVVTSHAGWTESTIYSNATRVVWTPGSVAAGSVDNSGSPATFTINASGTIRGAFFINNSVKGGVLLGTLFAEADFSASRTVASGDSLIITVTATQS